MFFFISDLKDDQVLRGLWPLTWRVNDCIDYAYDYVWLRYVLNNFFITAKKGWCFNSLIHLQQWKTWDKTSNDIRTIILIPFFSWFLQRFLDLMIHDSIGEVENPLKFPHFGPATRFGNKMDVSFLCQVAWWTNPVKVEKDASLKRVIHASKFPTGTWV